MATDYARHMVLEWGMSERLGFINYTPDPNRETIISEREYSQDTARIIDEEIKRLIDAAFADSQRVLDEHWELVVAVADNLLKYETLQGDELEVIMKGEALDRPSVSDLLAEETSTPATEAQGETESGDDEPAGDAIPSPA